MISCRLMYGLFSKLTVMANFTETNHHGIDFPANLASHTHVGNQTIFTSGNFTRGVVYPYLFTGVDLYAKFRFFTRDGEHRHLRMALYGEWSNVNVAHDEAEPTLMDDTKGYGGGLITTVLKNHLAVSFTTGFILPGKYDGNSPDLAGGPPGTYYTHLRQGMDLQFIFRLPAVSGTLSRLRRAEYQCIHGVQRQILW